MDPDHNQYSIDYLNQIAPPQKKPGVNNKLFFLIIGGGLLLATIIGIVILIGSSSSSGPKQKMQTLAARLTTLKTISGDAQKKLSSSALRGTNSNLGIFLTNANRDIAQPLANNGVDTTKLDKAIVAAEAGTALTTELEEARLNAVFDRTYAREMSYQLDTVAALMKTIYNSTNSTSLKDFLVTTDNNLQPIKKQFTDFNALSN
jgi:hypothetical protein